MCKTQQHATVNGSEEWTIQHLSSRKAMMLPLHSQLRSHLQSSLVRSSCLRSIECLLLGSTLPHEVLMRAGWSQC